MRTATRTTLAPLGAPPPLIFSRARSPAKLGLGRGARAFALAVPKSAAASPQLFPLFTIFSKQRSDLLTPNPIDLLNVVVTVSRIARSRAKREAGAAYAKAGAAPATVSGEFLCPEHVTEAARLWEDGTRTTTREPGDLPRHLERPRAGCPGGSLDSVCGLFRHDIPHATPLGPCPQ